MAEPSDVAVMTFELLKKLQGSVAVMQQDLSDVKVRMTSIEGQMGQITQHIGHVETMVAGTNRRLDRLEERAGRIERRLDLTDA